MALVSLDFVKQALRIAERDDEGNILDHEDDGVLQAYIDTASEAVVRYLKEGANDDWDESTTPAAVRQAVVIAVQGLYDPDQVELLSGLGTSDPKNPIVALLCMMRKPTLA
ncbi:head-tail connector protein [Mycoplana rhizolycopersici]|uniref:Phage gp6-like head-tail connector protein n=1 Tax=Mycoplana rhizolycopersici TaxID=2746702 RepID=A0ABX2QH81_9HYPH|nr:head-tail connector protein [Rhizobium rhizolycopersici]NVP55968.1 phage gp6-like head-tail connector protein [Rhizobium rhizolycopersici]